MQILFLMWFLQCFGRKIVWKWSSWSRVGCCTHQLQPEQSTVSADCCCLCTELVHDFSFIFWSFLFAFPLKCWVEKWRTQCIYTTGYCVFLVGKLWEEKPHNCIVDGTFYNFLVLKKLVSAFKIQVQLLVFYDIWLMHFPKWKYFHVF